MEQITAVMQALAAVLALSLAAPESDEAAPRAVDAAVIAARAYAVVSHAGATVDPRAGWTTLHHATLREGETRLAMDALRFRAVESDGVVRWRIEAHGARLAGASALWPDWVRTSAPEDPPGVDVALSLAYALAESSAELVVEIDAPGWGRATMAIDAVDLRWRALGDAPVAGLKTEAIETAAIPTPKAAWLVAPHLQAFSDAARADGIVASLTRLLIEAVQMRAVPGGGPRLDGVVRRVLLSFDDDGATDRLVAASPGETDADRRAAARDALMAWSALPDAGDALGVFVAEPDVLTVTVSPEIGFAELSALIERSADPTARRRLWSRAAPELDRAAPQLTTPIPYARLRAAAVSGYGVAPTGQLDLAEALVSGLGAPRNVDLAIDLAEADAGDLQAQRLLAAALMARGESLNEAYAAALTAEAGGDPEAPQLVERLEATLPLDEMVEVQADVAARLETEAIATLRDQAERGDLDAMRRLSRARLLGRGASRDLRTAYYWSAIAAASGDAAAARLRDEIVSRFINAESADRASWEALMSQEDARAFRAWTDGGLGDRLVE